ncbi:hypothetical protein Q5425_08570 [Amycolatopsis sp. A133]|uniref:hypothetical protein n=1 Tax=Amycolatopsis sp. A133 TaxID=3064472 RepID=UPI0027FBE102|nr:hypothetical protein [Amycolatopsis sp. A133]MDQ7803784.1 hypothetical protein [Amycolatopsis sp. A133]
MVCTTEPDHQRPGKTKSRAYPDFAGPPVPAARTLAVDTLGHPETGAPPGTSRRPFTAALPLTAVKVVIDFGIGTSVEADVVDGMVAVGVPANIGWLPEATVHVRARDALNRTVYDGSLRLI